MGLPTDESALLALRTQQVIAHESGVADTVDPLGGSYFVEYLTDRLEESAQSLLARIEDRARGRGYRRRLEAQIEDAAYAEARRQADGSGVVVGVNRYATGGGAAIPVLEVDPALEEEQRRRLAGWRAARDEPAVGSALGDLQDQAEGDGNLLTLMKVAATRGHRR